MKRFWVLTVIAVLSAAGAALAQGDPFIGTWKLNPTKAKYTAGAPPKEETVTIASKGGQDQLTAKGTAPNGTPIAISYEVPVKGGKGKILSGGPFDGVTERVVDENTRDITYMKDGKDMLHIHAVTSKDGKTMRLTIKGTDPDGKPLAGMSSWEKQ